MSATWITEGRQVEGVSEKEAAIDAMARMVTGLNIERLRRKLTEETDEGMRQTLCCLLAEEETNLVALMMPRNSHPRMRLDRDRRAA